MDCTGFGGEEPHQGERESAFSGTALANQAEDFLALEARLLKDLAFSRRADTEPMLRRAAQAYEEVASRTDGTYSRQNAALLWTLAGEGPRAEHLARSVAERITELESLWLELAEEKEACTKAIAEMVV